MLTGISTISDMYLTDVLKFSEGISNTVKCISGYLHDLRTEWTNTDEHLTRWKFSPLPTSVVTCCNTDDYGEAVVNGGRKGKDGR